jgi:hypothetical protein
MHLKGVELFVRAHLSPGRLLNHGVHPSYLILKDGYQSMSSPVSLKRLNSPFRRVCFVLLKVVMHC